MNEQSVSGGRPAAVPFPPRIDGEERSCVNSPTGVIVIVGPNGSGKSRLGAYLELNVPRATPVHRVSAQKIIEMPLTINAGSLTRAESQLLYGSEGAVEYLSNPKTLADIKNGNRWQGAPTVHTLNDYPSLLSYLFSEHSSVMTEYSNLVRQEQHYIEPPLSKLEKAKRIWESAIVHRELVIGGMEIHTRPRGGGSQYNAREMSDGERVVLYLAGHCLSAPMYSVLVIDEPELHLHRSIQSRLWNSIEHERNDCMFVYITHDLDFASSRQGATKIAVSGYDGSRWAWDVIPEQESIPESILMEIAGSRKPIVFVEGDRGGLDYQLASAVYPEYSVVPVGSCEHVIHAVRSFNHVPTLHWIKCVGIIDRDLRSTEEVEFLESLGVYSLRYSEIEHVLLAPAVVLAVASLLRFKQEECNRILSDVQAQVLLHLEKNADNVVNAMASRRVESLLRTFDSRQAVRDGLQESVSSLQSTIDVNAYLQEARMVVRHTLEFRDYETALQIYANKGLIHLVSNLFGLASRSYVDFVRRAIEQADSSDLITVVRSELPILPIQTRT